MGPISPIRPIRLVRRERRTEDKRREPPAVSVTVSVAPPPAPAGMPTPPAPTAEAHMIAQTARARGLRGGQQILDDARSAYLETEYSGASDRRAHTGQVTKKDV